jgi:glyoxylase-like metal-dependent hydrolase (beta-lactamase superfamily II)
MHQIEPGILYEDSYFGVTLGALISPSGVIMIDAPLRSEEARAWRTNLLNQRGGINRVLVCLDAHPDRTLGARALESTIIAHQNTALVFRNRPTIFKGQSPESGSDWETSSDAIGIRWASPDITFSERMTLHWGNVDVILEHHPGPMPGSLWVSIPDTKVIFVGDAVLVNQPPFLAYADLESWITSLEQLVSVYKDYFIVSGRGGPVTIKEVRAYIRVLKSVLDGFEKLNRKDSAPEAVESLVNPLLKTYLLDNELRERYAQRLRYGLIQCYARRYRSTNEMGDSDIPTDEQ